MSSAASAAAIRASLTLVAAVVAASATARAHESDYSYLRLAVAGARIEGEWEVHLRDARIALGLSGDLEGEPAWGELRARASELKALLADRIALSSAAGSCPPAFDETWTERPGGRDYVLLRLSGRCAGAVDELRLGYTLLFDLDDRHRGFFAVEDARLTHVGVFTAAEREVRIQIHQLDAWRQFGEYLREGVDHIWHGIDHLLFLVALLLPAPLARAGAGWQARRALAPVAADVAKTVTAFTVSHSLTLALAVLGFVQLPPRWVEAAIALSVFAAAWNNVRPFLAGRAWVLAFGFGLVHGLGFAGALVQLGLPRQAKGLALLAFNVGVEVGQLAVVALVLPLIYAARSRRRYELLALRAGSLAIAWLAALWLIERLLDIEIVGSL